MTTITITRPARCKDCRFCKPEYQGKRKIHRCNNPESEYYQSQITLRDYVCDNQEL